MRRVHVQRSTTDPDGEYLGKRYAERLGKVKAGSASLSFRRAFDIDLDVLPGMAAQAWDLAP
ncbi:hypothetical protein BH23CHL10_BH23CHL10_12310 [soil metagenome]